MSVRLTVNLQLEVIDAEAVIDASPYNYCKCVAPIARNLIGLQIAPGWTNKSKTAMGRNKGCTHLSELLGPVATTAIQTIASEKMKRDRDSNNSRSSYFIDSCHSLSSDSPVVKMHWPDQYNGTD